MEYMCIRTFVYRKIIMDCVVLQSPQRTSFFLPLGTVKALHVTSETTVHEVPEAL